MVLYEGSQAHNDGHENENEEKHVKMSDQDSEDGAGVPKSPEPHWGLLDRVAPSPSYDPLGSQRSVSFAILVSNKLGDHLLT